jgi:hypothetical protein
MRFIGLGCAVALACAGLAGCGGDGRLHTAGRVVKDGRPYTVPADEHVRVTFYQLNPDGTSGKNSYIAEFHNSDGTFRAIGPDGRGIPPGRYQVCLEHLRKRTDLFRGAFNNDATPFVFDIDSKTKELVIDLDRRS